MLSHTPRAEFGKELRAKGDQRTARASRTSRASSMQSARCNSLIGGRSYNRAVAAVVTLLEFKRYLLATELDPNECRSSRKLLHVQVAIVVLVDLFKSIPEVVEKDLAAAETHGLKQRRLCNLARVSRRPRPQSLPTNRNRLLSLTRYCSSFLNSSRPIKPSPAAHRHHVHDVALYKDSIHCACTAVESAKHYIDSCAPDVSAAL